MPDGPAHFVAGERNEIGPPALDVGDVVWDELAGVDDRQSASGLGSLAQHCNRCDRAEHVAHRGEREDLRPVEQIVEIGQVELTVSGEWNPANLDLAFLNQHHPRNDVGVMLHLGEYDNVTFAKIGSTPCLGNEVHRLRGVLGEHDFVDRRCVDQSGDGDAALFVGIGRLAGEPV